MAPRRGGLGLPTARVTEKLGSLKGKRVVIMGDIAHSRVARSNIYILRKLGASVAVPAIALANPGATHFERFSVGTTAVSVEMPESQFSAGTESLLAWIRRSMNIVSAYYGRFPTETLRIRLIAEDGGGVRASRGLRDELSRDLRGVLTNEPPARRQLNDATLPVGERPPFDADAT